MEPPDAFREMAGAIGWSIAIPDTWAYQAVGPSPASIETSSPVAAPESAKSSNSRAASIEQFPLLSAFSLVARSNASRARRPF